jgi:hypothetical protein
MLLSICLGFENMTPAITPESPNPSTASPFMTPESDALQTDLSDTTESDVEKSNTGKYPQIWI